MNPDQSSIALVFQELADSFRISDGIIDVFDRLVTTSTAYTSATEGGIVLADAHRDLHVLLSSTSERAADVEEAQLGTSEGPCLDCYRTGEPVEVPDLGSKHDEWPAFSRIAEERGFAAVHATPLRLRDRTLGTLCLFSTHSGPLSDRDAALVQTLADAATVAVLQEHVIAHQDTLNAQLEHALESRIVIEQAKGALAHRLGVSVDEAFAILRQRSRTTGTRIHDLATSVIEREVQ